MLHTAARASHLLVVGDRGGGGAQVHHEAQVGLVEAHAQCRRRDQSFDAVGEQVLLGLLAVRVLRLPGIGLHDVPALAQERRDFLGRGHGERVDDAGARQVVQMLGQPGHPVRGVRQPQYAEAQALPVQRTAQDQRVGAHSGAQLFGDIGRHAGVGRRGGGQHRGVGREVGEHGAQAAVVRPEIVAPVGDAVRLVHDQEAGGRGQFGQHLVTEVRIVQPLRAHQEDVDLARRHLGLDGLPLLRVRGVDRPRADSGSGRRLHLVAHQREQR